MKNKSKNQLMQNLTDALRKESAAKKILNLTIDGFCLVNEKGDILDVNDAFCKISGYKYSEAITMNLLQFTRKGSKTKLIHAVKNIKKKGSQHFESFLKRKDGKILNIESSINFLTENKKNVFIFVRDISSRKILEEKVLKQKKELEMKNIALKELLAQIELEKEQLKKNFLTNIEELILPPLKKIRINSSKQQSQRIKMIEQDLENLTSSFSYKLTRQKNKLTPKELEIGNMIKNGLSSKEIASILNTSLRTVENHRQNIRKKFEIAHQKINLISYLQNF